MKGCCLYDLTQTTHLETELKLKRVFHILTMNNIRSYLNITAAILRTSTAPNQTFPGIAERINQLSVGLYFSRKNIHTSSNRNAFTDNGSPKQWLSHNKKIFPPQSPEEERRPAFVCHMKSNIKYSPWKMWYIATLVRGMTVDEAVKQLSFILKRGAEHAKDTILEAQELAVKKHYVEYKSNLWIAESFVGKGKVIKGVRRHARSRVGKVEYMHCHYFVRLEEGKPPKNYYATAPKTGEQMLETWMDQMRSRKITSSL